MQFFKFEDVSAACEYYGQPYTIEERNIANERLENAIKIYEQYLQENEVKIGKRLVAFHRKNNFHDFSIEKISFLTNASSYKAGKDAIVLLLRGGVTSAGNSKWKYLEIELHFEDIRYFFVKRENKRYFQKSYEILFSEIGIQEDGFKFFNFLACEGDEINITYRKIKWNVREVK